MKENALIYYPDGPEFWLGSRELVLARKSAEIMALLVENQHRFVSTDEILEVVWPSTVVTRDLVKDYIAKIRKQLSSNMETSLRIETRRRFGYRLIGEIRYCDSLLGIGRSPWLRKKSNNEDGDIAGVVRKTDLLLTAPTEAQYRRAKKILNESLERWPSSTDILLQYSVLQHAGTIHSFKSINQGDSAELALQYAASAYGQRPKCETTAARFASALAQNREFHIAGAVLEKAISNADCNKNQKLLGVYADQLAQTGMHETSSNVIKEMIIKFRGSTHPSNYWKLACNLFQLQEYEEALFYIEKYIGLFPKTMRPKHAQVAILAKLRRQKEAESVLGRLMADNPSLDTEHEYRQHTTYYQFHEDGEKLVEALRLAGLK